jgi:hypothetical protein
MGSRTLFDDIGSTVSGADALDGLILQRPQYQQFYTGTTAVTLTSIQFVLSATNTADGGTISVALFSDAAGAPGTSVATLGTIDDSSLSTSAQTITFNVSSSPTLTAGTQYWIELLGTGSSASWSYSTAATGTGVSGESSDPNAGVGNAVSTTQDFLMNVTASSLCFAAGTRIMTERGEVAVEDLQEGDLAVGLRRARLAPVQWIGRRRVDLRAHPKPAEINPVRVRADAFGPGQPHRDLILSPNHALYVDGHLIAVRYLLNGATIVQEAWDSVEYFHVELDAHDVVLANGLAAESFLDVGNRAGFANGGQPMMLHPDFACPDSARAVWEAYACAPDLPRGDELTALRQRLLDRATSLGHRRTADPLLCARAGGRILMPQCDGNRLSFSLPKDAGAVRLSSRSVIPGEMLGSGGDGRRLGIGVIALTLDDQSVPLDDACFGEGWHPAEETVRWTQGEAWLHSAGAHTLTLTLLDDISYWSDVEAEDPPALVRA